MTSVQLDRFNRLRKRVADAIAKYLEDDYGHKSYEGTWEMLISFPNYFDDETATAKPDFYRITLHCYVIGPARHYDWDGKNWDECLAKCEKDVCSWLQQEVDNGCTD